MKGFLMKSGKVSLAIFAFLLLTGGEAFSAFSVGNHVQVANAPKNVRATPATNGVVNGIRIDNGDLGTVLSGPTTNNGYTWYYVNFDSDPDGWIIESGLASAQAKCDLTFSGTPYVSPSPVQAGNNISVVYTVKNVGAGNAAGSTTKIQIKTSGGTSSGIPDQPFSEPALSSGASAPQSRNIPISSLSSGNYTAYIILDSGNLIGQSDTSPSSDERGINFAISAASTVTLTLYVHDGSASGSLLVGARVTGSDGAGSSFDQTTGTGGYVTITGTPGTWSFVVSKSGYAQKSWSQSITITSQKDAYLIASAQAPTITTTSPLSAGTTGNYYSQTLAASGGTTPYSWSYSGSLPSGLTLNSSGVISGTPSMAGPASFTIKVAGNDGPFSTATFSLTINAAQTSTPSISSLFPSQIKADPANAYQSVTINGANFVSKPSILVTWTNPSLGSATLLSSNVTFVSSSQLAISIRLGQVADSWTIKVSNPDGKTSDVQRLQVLAPYTDTYPHPSENFNNPDEWNFYFRECTSYVAWRINCDACTTASPWFFSNRMAGEHWGNASNWNENAVLLGYTVDNIPERGAIAQWDSGVGHVAYVEDVNPDGSINVSEYNKHLDHNYGYRCNIAATAIDHYIHVKYSTTLLPPSVNGPGTSTDTGYTLASLTPQFSWNGVAGITTYGLYISKSPYGSTNLVYSNTAISGSATVFTLPAGILTNGAKYRWLMTSWANGKESGNSATNYFQTPSQIATYTASYNANGATSGTVPASQTKTNGIALTLRANSGNLAKTGYAFAGWNTAANGLGTDYAAGASYTVNATVTLYAKWTASGAVSPLISIVSPNPITYNATNGYQTVTISGANFVDKPTVTLTWTMEPLPPAGGYIVPSTQVTFISSSQLSISIRLGAVADNWTVKVTNPDGKFSNMAGLQVVASGGGGTVDYPEATWIPAGTGHFTTASRGPTDVKSIIIHTTEDSSYGAAIAWFQNPTGDTSAHYIVQRNGSVVQMVREKDIAHHAGTLGISASWIWNQYTIGIEIERLANATEVITSAQYSSVKNLVDSIRTRFNVPFVFPVETPISSPSVLMDGIMGHGKSVVNGIDPVKWDWVYFQGLYASGPPEMDVQGNSISIADGDTTPSISDHTDFGSVLVNGETVVRTFTIRNPGSGALNLTGSPKVAMSGTHAAEFVVTAQPISPVSAVSGTTTFQVTFDPAGTGTRSATLSIANNDSNENPYNFAIQGTGAGSLADAVDQPSLTFSTSGSLPWNAQTITTRDGSDAVKSGAITNSQTSVMQTTISGPGTLSFWWKVSSERDWDCLTFYINEVEQEGKISGEVNWQQKSYTLTSESHTLKWVYSKDFSASVGSDCGWVDQLTLSRAVVSTVTFDSQGGTAPSPSFISVTNGATYGSLPTTTRTGYTFGGWYTGPNGTGFQVTSGTAVTITTGQILYAKWAGNAYIVTFDAQGGTASQSSKIVTTGSTYGTLATTARSGYTFGGWYTGQNGAGTPISSGTAVALETSQILYAKWVGNNYTVTFDAQGGTTPSSSSKIVVVGSTYGPLANTSRAGYTFGGWHTGPNGTGTEVTSEMVVEITTAQMVYAKWIGSSHTVSFDAMGGTTPSPSSKIVTVGSTYGTLATTSRSGYTFGGWYTGPNGTGNSIASGTAVTFGTSQILYAKWIGISYTVTFDAQGGTVSSPTAKSVIYGSTYGTMANTIRTGFTFGGWWTGVSGTGAEVTFATPVSIATAQTLYAKWTIALYTLTVADGAGGAVTCTNGQQLVITAGVPAVGMTFNRWIGYVEYVANVTSAMTTVTMPAQDIMLIATYKAAHYKLTVVGGTGSGLCTNGQKVIIRATVPVGMKFREWNDGNTNTSRIIIMPPESVTYTANFTDNTKPTVTIKTPTALQKVFGTNGNFTVTGTATDNLALSNVMVKVNSGSFAPAGTTTNVWKNWSRAVTLTLGTNTIAAYSVDTTGNHSLTSTVKCVYTETGSLNITTNGPGKVTVAPTGPLLLGKTYTLTAAANAGAVFSNWTGYVNSTGKVVTVTLTAANKTVTVRANFTDTTKPTVVITYPANNSKVMTNGTVFIRGTAADNGVLKEVKYQLRTGSWTNAISTNIFKAWTAPYVPVAGLNTSKVYSVDMQGNSSATSTVVFTYIPGALLTVQTNLPSRGTITPSLNGKVLQIGSTNTMTAAAKAGYVFTNWTYGVGGSVVTNGKAVKFVMRTNLVLTANFNLTPLKDAAADVPAAPQTIVVDGSSKDWTDIPRSAFSYSSRTQEVAVALDGNNIALLLNGCPFSTSDTVLVYFKLRLTYGTADNRHTVDLWTSGSVLYGMVDGQAITGLEAAMLSGVLEVKFPVEQAPSQVTIEEVGCGMDLGNGSLTELFKFFLPGSQKH